MTPKDRREGWPGQNPAGVTDHDSCANTGKHLANKKKTRGKPKKRPQGKSGEIHKTLGELLEITKAPVNSEG